MKKKILSIATILLLGQAVLSASLDDNSTLINQIGKNILSSNRLPNAEFIITDTPDTFDDYFIKANVYKKVVKELFEKREYRDKYAEILKFNDIIVACDGEKFDDEITRKIEEILNKSTNDMLKINNENTDLYQYGLNYYSGAPYIRMQQYKNHEIREYCLNKNLNKEMFELITTKINKETINKIDKVYNDTLDANKTYISCGIIYLEDSSNGYKSYDNFMRNGFSNYKAIIEYLKTNYDEKCDINRPYYTFEFYGRDFNKSCYWYINQSEELDTFLKQYYIEDETEEKYVDEVIYE